MPLCGHQIPRGTGRIPHHSRESLEAENLHAFRRLSDRAPRLQCHPVKTDWTNAIDSHRDHRILHPRHLLAHRARNLLPRDDAATERLCREIRCKVVRERRRVSSPISLGLTRISRRDSRAHQLLHIHAHAPCFRRTDEPYDAPASVTLTSPELGAPNRALHHALRIREGLSFGPDIMHGNHSDGTRNVVDHNRILTARKGALPIVANTRGRSRSTVAENGSAGKPSFQVWRPDLRGTPCITGVVLTHPFI